MNIPNKAEVKAILQYLFCGGVKNNLFFAVLGITPWMLQFIDENFGFAYFLLSSVLILLVCLLQKPTENSPAGEGWLVVSAWATLVLHVVYNWGFVVSALIIITASCIGLFFLILSKRESNK